MPAPRLGWLGADRCEVWRDVFVLGGVAAQNDAPVGGGDGAVAEDELRSGGEQKLVGEAFAPRHGEEAVDRTAGVVDIGQVGPGAGGVEAQVSTEYLLCLFSGQRYRLHLIPQFT